MTGVSAAGGLGLGDGAGFCLVETRGTNGGLNRLEALRLRDWLELPATFLPDPALGHPRGLPDLATLRLNRLKVTDAGLAHLEGLTRLRLLESYEDGVTDAGLEHLQKLTNLTWLMLTGTQV